MNSYRLDWLEVFCRLFMICSAWAGAWNLTLFMAAPFFAAAAPEYIPWIFVWLPLLGGILCSLSFVIKSLIR